MVSPPRGWLPRTSTATIVAGANDFIVVQRQGNRLGRLVRRSSTIRGIVAGEYNGQRQTISWRRPARPVPVAVKVQKLNPTRRRVIFDDTVFVDHTGDEEDRPCASRLIVEGKVTGRHPAAESRSWRTFRNVPSERPPTADPQKLVTWKRAV